MNSGRFNISQLLIVAAFLIAALVLVFWLGQPNSNSGQSGPPNKNPVSPGSPAPSSTPQQTAIPQETTTPQETGTPWYVELSPAVSNEETHQAEGGEPTPNAIQLAQMEEAALGDSLFIRQGTVIAQGTNRTPTSQGLTTYRIEEVVMTGTVSLTWGMPSDNPPSSWGAQRVTFDRFWRLTVSGPGIDIPKGEYGHVIWINGNRVGAGKPLIHDVSTIVFDRSLLPEGGRIAVSIGDFLALSQEVPETIHYNSQP